MSRYSSYSTSGLKKFEAERQRDKAADLTKRFEAERLALSSILKGSVSRKVPVDWMGQEEAVLFTPQKFSVKNRPRWRFDSKSLYG